MKNVNRIDLIFIFAAFIIAVLVTCSEAHSEVLIEQGQSTILFADPQAYTPATYTAMAYRSEGPKYIELIQGGWTGVNSSRFLGASVGGRSPGQYFVEYSLGGVYLLYPETVQLDGNKQFLITLGIGARFDNLYTTVRLRHFSNANTQGKNRGFEVLVFSLGVKF